MAKWPYAEPDGKWTAEQEISSWVPGSNGGWWLGVVEGRRAATLPFRTLGSLRFRKPGWGEIGETRRVDRSNNSFLNSEIYRDVTWISTAFPRRFWEGPPAPVAVTCFGRPHRPRPGPALCACTATQSRTLGASTATVTPKGNLANEEGKKHSNRGQISGASQLFWGGLGVWCVWGFVGFFFCF